MAILITGWFVPSNIGIRHHTCTDLVSVEMCNVHRNSTNGINFFFWIQLISICIKIVVSWTGMFPLSTDSDFGNHVFRFLAFTPVGTPEFFKYRSALHEINGTSFQVSTEEMWFSPNFHVIVGSAYMQIANGAPFVSSPAAPHAPHSAYDLHAP